MQHVQTAATTIAAQRIRGVGDPLQFGEHGPGYQQRAFQKPGLHDVHDASVDDHTGVKDLRGAPAFRPAPPGPIKTRQRRGEFVAPLHHKMISQVSEGDGGAEREIGADSRDAREWDPNQERQHQSHAQPDHAEGQVPQRHMRQTSQHPCHSPLEPVPHPHRQQCAEQTADDNAGCEDRHAEWSNRNRRRLKHTGHLDPQDGAENQTR